MTDAMMESLCQLSHITTLRLGGSSALTDAGIALLAIAYQRNEPSGNRVSAGGGEAGAGSAVSASAGRGGARR